MNWIAETIPWEILSKKFDGRQKQTELSNDLSILTDTKCDPFEIEACKPADFKNDELLSKFFGENGRPILSKFGPNVHLWILHYVTKGRVRSDKNKSVYVFHGRPKNPEDTVWIKTIIENNHSGFWKKHEDPFKILEQINDECNLLYEDLLKKYSNCCEGKQGDIFRNHLINLRRLPEFAAYQSHRSHAHKQNVWSYLGEKQGGNKDRCDPQKSIPHRIQSVHWYLVKFHKFLGPIQRKVIIV